MSTLTIQCCLTTWECSGNQVATTTSCSSCRKLCGKRGRSAPFSIVRAQDGQWVYSVLLWLLASKEGPSSKATQPYSEAGNQKRDLLPVPPPLQPSLLLWNALPLCSKLLHLQWAVNFPLASDRCSLQDVLSQCFHGTFPAPVVTVHCQRWRCLTVPYATVTQVVWAY